MELASSSLLHKYAEGDVGDRYYQGCEFFDGTDSLGNDLLLELFNSAVEVDLRSISGANAN